MFFDASSFCESKYSMEHFREWAGAIASSYFHSGMTPTASLKKFAQAEDLTPDQISLLATETNKLIHQQKYASAGGDKYHAADFPLADAAAVIAGLQVDGGVEKTAVEMPDPVFSDRSPDAFEMWGVKEESVEEASFHEKTASCRHEVKHALEKTALLHQKVADAITLSRFAVESAEKSFIKEARQVVLGGSNSAERLALLGTVYHFAKEAGMEEVARRPLAKVAYVVAAEGLVDPVAGKKSFEWLSEKTADQKAPPELVSGWLNARVVNGQHPLYITLKTVKSSQDKLRQNCERFSVVDDQLKILGQKVRAL